MAISIRAGSFPAGLPVVLAGTFLLGCARNDQSGGASPQPPREAVSSGSQPTSVPREPVASPDTNPDSQSEQLLAAASQQPADSASSPPAPAASQPAAERPQESPAEPALTEKQQKIRLAHRIESLLKQLEAEEPPPAEKELQDEIRAKQELYRLLRADIADEQANPRRESLLMPWEFSGRDFMAALPGANSFKPPRQHYSLSLSLAFGNEQLAEVQQLIRHNSYALANLRAQRVWPRLSTTEQQECRNLHPEFAAEASGENAKKLEELTTRITQSPDNAEAFGERARLNWQRGDLISASADFRRAIQLAGESAYPLRLQYAQLCEERGDNWNAKSEYQQVAHAEAKVEPALRFDAYIRWGYVLLQEKRTEAAMQAVKQAVLLNDKNAAAHVLAAEVYKQAGVRLMVISSLESAVEAEPENPGMHYRLANVLANAGLIDDALASYSKAIELEPTWWRPRAGKASLLFRQGKKDGALAELDEALKWEPGEVSLLESRIVVLQELGREDEAKQLQQTLDARSK